MPRPTTAAALAIALLAVLPTISPAAGVRGGPPLTIQRLRAPITLDGVLDDAGWKDVPPLAQWFETNVSDNTEPQVRNVGRIAYDDHYLYAAFEFDDPHPEQIRAPIADHDQLSGSTDYGGVIVDSGDDGKSAILFLANANGLQYDAVSNDASGEDSSPDYFWQSAGRVTATGWALEIRIPFTSLRYSNVESPTWGLLLYRNYPRDRHYQFFTARMPRNSNCFVCNASPLTGLAGLPHGEHLVVAPHVTAQRTDVPPADAPPGSPLERGRIERDAGLDVKWSPVASIALDATLHPDFSQVEADVPQIGANERFALYYPEKRSFFLEGIDLFATPFQAVYTRSITAPSAGGRVTGRAGATSFTALVAHDLGQGVVTLPGPQGSDQALQDFSSDVGVMRVRRDFGRSAVSILGTGRTMDGGAHNTVVGPDVEWRPRPSDTFAAQALWSDSRTPVRPDLAAEWDGRSLRDRALLARWSHNTRSLDVFLQGQDLGRDFRADEGFVPQVGYREVYFESGWTVRPEHAFLSRIRYWTIEWQDEDESGALLSRRISAGAGMDGRLNSFLRLELNRDELAAGGEVFTRFRPRVQLQASPNRLVNNLNLETTFGQEVDFANARLGTGATFTGSVTLHPNDHLDVRPYVSLRRLAVDDPALGKGRLFLAQVERVRVAWSFDAHTFVRVIGQHVRTERTPWLYTFPVPRRAANFDVSALVGHSLDWQTVFYLGYGDLHATVDEGERFRPAGRQVFAKLSYALQR